MLPAGFGLAVAGSAVEKLRGLAEDLSDCSRVHRSQATGEPAPQGLWIRSTRLERSVQKTIIRVEKHLNNRYQPQNGSGGNDQSDEQAQS